MRLGIFGPSLFRLAVGLRDLPDCEVTYFIDRNSFILARELRDEPHVSDTSFCRAGDYYSRSDLLRPSSSLIVSELNEFDLVLMADLGPVFGPSLDVPYVFLPAGGDLTCAPFPIRSRHIRRSGILGPRGLRDAMSASVLGLAMRRGIRAASAVWLWSGPFRPWLTALDRLGLPHPTSDQCLPAAIDTDLFQPDDSGKHDGRKGDRTLTAFLPSRLMINSHKFLVETGQWKRNDVFIEGVAEAIHRGVDLRLTLLEHTVSGDADRALDLIRTLRIDNQVDWIQPTHPAGFSWRELAPLYRAADLVADDFGAGWFGTVALEAAACGTPVFNVVDEEPMSVVYPEGHPFITASSASDISDWIIQFQDAGTRDDLGKASAEWATEHHNTSDVARRCHGMIRNLISDDSLTPLT